MIVTEFDVVSLEDTQKLGERIGNALRAGDIVCLDGTLGAGKTTLTKSIAASLGIPSHAVTSPTFSLVNEYLDGALPLYHLDLYRLDRPDQLATIGFDDYLSAGDGAIIIEWAVNAADELPDDVLGIQIRITDDNSSARIVTLSAEGRDSIKLLARISGSSQS